MGSVQVSCLRGTAINMLTNENFIGVQVSCLWRYRDMLGEVVI